MTKKLIALFLVLLTTLTLVVACTTSEDEYYEDDYATEEAYYDDEATDEATEEAYDEEATDEATDEATGEEDSSFVSDGTCIGDLEALVNDDSELDGSEDLPSDLDEEYILVIYSVDGDEISSPEPNNNIPAELVEYQDDTATQEYIWQFFVDLIPADQRQLVDQFVIFSDGYSNVIGAVDEGSSANTWSFEMDIIDAADFATLSTTVIHEFGHMLTLSDTQINDKSSCNTYQSIDGCSESDSYVNAFYDAFWTNLYSEWESTVLDSSGEVDEDAVIEFYDQYSDQFVTDYAPTGVEEDIAESFMYFIFSAKPAGDTIAEQKILFFYDYPELVQMREDMLTVLCEYAEK